MIVVMPCYARPEYLARTLDQWSRVRGIEHVSWAFLIDAGGDPDVPRQAIDFDLPGAKLIVHHEEHQGLNRNIHEALVCGFQHSDFTIVAEDDVLPSADALEFFHWASWELEDQAIAAACAFNERAREGEPHDAYLADGHHFRPWLWGTWFDRWPTFSAGWDFDNTHRGWDCHLGDDMIPASPWPWVVRPTISRSDHIGEHGVHMNPDAFASAQAPAFRPEGEEPGRWRLQPSVS